MQRYLLDTGLLLDFTRRASLAVNARGTLNLRDPQSELKP